MDMIITYLEKFGKASRKDIENLITDKLSNVLTSKQKKSKVGNLLTKLRKQEKIRVDTAKMWVLI